MSNRTAIVIVNWNCWEDTVRCINACGQLSEFNGAVIVVDNGSTDASFLKLQDWAAGLCDVATTSSNSEISALERKGPEPLKFTGAFDEKSLAQRVGGEGLDQRGWYLINAFKNSGFGAGNNVGLRVAMQDSRCDLFWCLNADAIPAMESWAELASACGGMSTPCVSGSVLLNYDQPDSIQTIGSSFSKDTLLVSYQYVNKPLDVLKDLPETLLVGYPIGASLLINRAFIELHGYFDERYFLYYEEPDLVVRLKTVRQSFVCTKSLIYHKGGQTTGGGSSVKDRSLLADYQYNRSRMILARKIGGKTLLLTVLVAMYSILRRIRSGRIDLAKKVIPACFDGWCSAR